MHMGFYTFTADVIEIESFLQNPIFTLNNKTIAPQKIVLLQSDQGLYYLPLYQHLSNTSAGCNKSTASTAEYPATAGGTKSYFVRYIMPK